jgi:hypothetical protein
MRTTIFALRLLIPGAIFATAGFAMLFSKEYFSMGWRFAAGGVLCIGLGVYVLLRKRDAAPNEVASPAPVPEEL